VVGEAVGAVVEDGVVGRLVEGIAGDGPMSDGRRLGEDALAGSAGVELVGWKDSADFEWFEHDFSPRFGR
jgi:hypothetical protein